MSKLAQQLTESSTAMEDYLTKVFDALSANYGFEPYNEDEYGVQIAHSKQDDVWVWVRENFFVGEEDEDDQFDLIAQGVRDAEGEYVSVKSIPFNVGDFTWDASKDAATLLEQALATWKPWAKELGLKWTMSWKN